MKITVIGAGAIGTMLGAILSKKGTKISFLTKNKTNRGNIILKNYKGETIEKKANYIDNLEESDWFILAVKSYDVEKLMEPLNEKAGKIYAARME